MNTLPDPFIEAPRQPTFNLLDRIVEPENNDPASVCVAVWLKEIDPKTGTIRYLLATPDEQKRPVEALAPGGKVEKGQTLREAAVEEVKEEVGLEIDPRGLCARAIILTTGGEPIRREGSTSAQTLKSSILNFHIVGKFPDGQTPVGNGEEMTDPRLVDFNRLPYDVMYPNDRLWGPFVLGPDITHRMSGVYSNRTGALSLIPPTDTIQQAGIKLITPPANGARSL